MYIVSVGDEAFYPSTRKQSLYFLMEDFGVSSVDLKLVLQWKSRPFII